jgi:hypothetical protein
MKDFTITIVNKGASSEIKRANYTLDQEGITSWLRSKHIISENEILFSYSDVNPWLRTGGETYGTSFQISTDKQTKHIFIKAIVTLSPEKCLMNWARRRNILTINGVPVSNWYSQEDGLIIEDYYPKTFHDVAFDKILTIGNKLDQLGFITLKFTDDLRADKYGNPFFVDFGFDLGEPSLVMTTTAKTRLLNHFPEKENEIIHFFDKNNNNTNVKVMIMSNELTTIIKNSILSAQNEECFFEEIFSDSSLPVRKNEFLFFVKPEITMESNTIKVDKIFELIQDKIKEFGFNIHNINILSADYLHKYNIIAQHYGVINSIACNAIQNMSESAKCKFKEIYGKYPHELKVLGGLEFLECYKDFNANSIDFLWQNKKCDKLAGGTYSLEVKIDDEIIYLINGFHPRQLSQYTAKGRSIIVMRLSGDISWEDARINFIGSTFPLNANDGSIRKELLRHKDELGLAEVSQALNGVHLSAGPVEALVELCRYNSNFSDQNKIKDYSDFSFGKQLLENFDNDIVNKIVLNINVDINGKIVSIFDLTEEKNSEEAIKLLINIFK